MYRLIYIHTYISCIIYEQEKRKQEKVGFTLLRNHCFSIHACTCHGFTTAQGKKIGVLDVKMTSKQRQVVTVLFRVAFTVLFTSHWVILSQSIHTLLTWVEKCKSSHCEYIIKQQQLHSSIQNTHSLTFFFVIISLYIVYGIFFVSSCSVSHHLYHCFAKRVEMYRSRTEVGKLRPSNPNVALLVLYPGPQALLNLIYNTLA